MDMKLFEKFNESFDVVGLQQDVDNAGHKDFVDVPHGDYEVAIAKLELGESKKGLPQLKVWFKVVAGEYRGQLIFMNQNVDKGFGIHNANVFLESLDSGVNVEFVDFLQYGTMIDKMFNAIDGRYEYQLAYGERVTPKGNFDTYNIVQKFAKQ